MRNWYATYKDIETQAAIPAGTSAQAVLESFLESSSRVIDDYCRRHFFLEKGALHFDGVSGDQMKIPDLQSLTTFAVDTERDLSWDGETWTENTDFYLSGMARIDQYPKRFVVLAPNSTKSFSEGRNLYLIAGQWGYGNASADPWKALVPTGTVADTTSATITLSAATAELYTGHTILIEDEQMFITSYPGSGTTVTVERAVNGTTAAAHSTKKVSKALYPRKVMQCCKDIVVESFFNRTALDGQFAVAGGDFVMQRNEEIFFRHLRMLEEYVVREVY